jgi:S-adenosylmethionine decarboxylase proenzyme
LEALGTHLLLELEGCNPELLDDLDHIRDSMVSAATETGATIVGETFHKFSPTGVTGVVAIAESHLCIHTWPERQYAAADIFTCGEDFDPNAAADLIIEKLRCQRPTVRKMSRGPVLVPIPGSAPTTPTLA